MRDKKHIWICYDFGLKGDYTGLYNWLDSNKAKDCGNGLAFLTYSKNALSMKSDFVESIKTDLINFVKLSPSDRVYVIWKDEESGLMKGRFISGSRKQPPWEGFSLLGTQTKDDVAE